jgi:putative transposase
MVALAIEVLERALRRYGAPEIFNSDHAGRSLRSLVAHAPGVQYTSPKFRKRLKAASVRISMDGKGRALYNAIIERFWRTIQYDEV